MIDDTIWRMFREQLDAQIAAGECQGYVPVALVLIPVLQRNDDAVVADAAGEPKVLVAGDHDGRAIAVALHRAAAGLANGTIR